MNPLQRVARHLAVCALACAPLAALAQGYYNPYDYSRPRPFFGGSIGASVFSDNSSATAGWLNGAYAANTPLAPGDFIVSSGSQDHAGFGAKLFGGAWITPNIGFELGIASLGSARWSVYSTNSTGSFSVSDSGTVEPYAIYESLLLGVDSGNARFFGKVGAYQAWTDLNADSIDNNSGGYFNASQTVHNTGALFGVGMTTLYGPFSALRVEVEDYVNVGDSSTTTIPPWRGSIVLVSIGYTFLF